MSRERLIRDANKYPAQRRSPKQESEIANRGGIRNPGSGSGPNHKADIRKYGGCFRIEAKSTGKASFSISLKDWRKVEDAAYPNREEPMMIIEFIDDAGRPIKELAVVPLWIAEEWASERVPE